MNRETLITEFTAAVREMSMSHFPGTYHWPLEERDGNDWAIVLGWSPGFEEDGTKYTDGTYGLCAKVAYQPSNSMLQCDYDVDWLMPYDESGEVYDTEISISDDTESIVDWLLKTYHETRYN